MCVGGGGRGLPLLNKQCASGTGTSIEGVNKGTKVGL